jgi:tetratricopeptide (TPR) repeat protein
MYAEQGDEVGLALVDHRVGVLHMRRGSYREAERLLQASRTRYRSLDRVVSAVKVSRDLARAYMALGDLEAALEVLDQAEREIAPIEAESLLDADLALARGDLMVYLNEPEEAAGHFERAAASYLRTSDETRYREAKSGSASLLILKEEYGAAARALQSLVASRGVEMDPRYLARTRIQLAYAQERAGNLEEALQSLRAALGEFDALGDPVGRAATLAALGDLERRRGATGGAKAFYQAGLSSLAAREAPEMAWILHRGLGEVLQREGDLDAAELQLRAAVDQVEEVAFAMSAPGYREAFFSDKWEVYAALAIVQQQSGRPADAFQTSERMRAQSMLVALDGGRFRDGLPRMSPLAEREQDLRRYVMQLSRATDHSALKLPGRRMTTCFANWQRRIRTIREWWPPPTRRGRRSRGSSTPRQRSSSTWSAILRRWPSW